MNSNKVAERIANGYLGSDGQSSAKKTNGLMGLLDSQLTATGTQNKKCDDLTTQVIKLRPERGETKEDYTNRRAQLIKQKESVCLSAKKLSVGESLKQKNNEYWQQQKNDLHAMIVDKSPVCTLNNFQVPKLKPQKAEANVPNNEYLFDGKSPQSNYYKSFSGDCNHPTLTNGVQASGAALANVSESFRKLSPTSGQPDFQGFFEDLGVTLMIMLITLFISVIAVFMSWSLALCKDVYRSYDESIDVIRRNFFAALNNALYAADEEGGNPK